MEEEHISVPFPLLLTPFILIACLLACCCCCCCYHDACWIEYAVDARPMRNLDESCLLLFSLFPFFPILLLPRKGGEGGGCDKCLSKYPLLLFMIFSSLHQPTNQPTNPNIKRTIPDQTRPTLSSSLTHLPQQQTPPALLPASAESCTTLAPAPPPPPPPPTPPVPGPGPLTPLRRSFRSYRPALMFSKMRSATPANAASTLWPLLALVST